MSARRVRRRDLCRFAAGVGWVVVAGRARAQAPLLRLRARIDGMKGNEASVTTRGGETLTVVLNQDTTIVAIVAIHLEDIKPGSYIGSAAMPQPDGSLRALEIHVFPETMRGTGEGHRPFDLQPQSTMTNGTVGTVTGSTGRTLQVEYKGGHQTIIVSPNTPVVTYEPGSVALLVPGAHVIMMARREQDGHLTATRISVGKDGLVPPM